MARKLKDENYLGMFPPEAHEEHAKKVHLEQKIKDTSFEIYDYEHDLSMKLDDLINKKNWKDSKLRDEVSMINEELFRLRHNLYALYDQQDGKEHELIACDCGKV